MKYNNNNNNNNGDGGGGGGGGGSSSNIDNTDGTMTALTVERMAEALNAGVQFPLGTLVPTKPLVKSLPTGIQTIMSTDFTHDHVMDTFFLT